MAGLQTEFPFTLPKGYIDGDGMLHRHGTMRLATARDEIEPLRDPRIAGPDDPYLTVIVLSRVVTELGTLGHVTPRDVEGMFAADLAFLQDLYGVINFGDNDDIAELKALLVAEAVEPEEDDHDMDAFVEADDVTVVEAGAGSNGKSHSELGASRRRERIEEVASRRQR